MAMELFKAFPSAATAASIHKEGDGKLVQYRSNSAFLGSDMIQNGEAEFQREIDRILKIILLNVNPSGRYTTNTLVDVVELTVPLVKFPDGGHRCSYFPCPTCHRTRSIFGLQSSLPQVSNCKWVIHPALIEEDEVIAPENPSAPSNAPILNETRSESVVPVEEFPDGGHKCPYFPCPTCPTCHRNRTLYPDFGRKS